MRKKRLVSTLMMIILVLVILLNLYILVTGTIFLDYSILSGLATERGKIMLYIVPELDFTIHNPTPGIKTYDVSSANFINGYWTLPVSLLIGVQNYINITEFNLSIYHADYGTYHFEYFLPNISMNVRLGENTIIVGAQDNYSNTLVKSVTFTVRVDDSEPVIDITDTEWYACEDKTFEKTFNVTDLDNPVTIDVFSIPSDPFYGENLGKIAAGVFNASINTQGRRLEQSHVGLNPITIRVLDLIAHMDEEDVNITVINVNKVPIIDDLGVQLVWTSGVGTNFSYIWSADDVDEDGDLSNGILNLTLNISLNGTPVNLFNISSIGEINFTANDSTPLGIYDVNICVEDTNLTSPHENITSICNETGESNLACDNFTLTVTNQNRAPEILVVDPLTFPIFTLAKTFMTFNVTAYDPDVNPIDIEWSLNGGLITRNSFSYHLNKTYTDELVFQFPCGLYGWLTLTVNVTDGDLYDSYSWPVHVDRGDCDAQVKPTGGGGGGGVPGVCYQSWVCPDWDYCWSVDSYYDSGLIDVFARNSYKDQCNQLGYNDTECGFQTRECVDLNQCKKNIVETEKPGGSEQACHYVDKAGCSDGVKNCHDGACEILVDCGGPCGPCSTCSDNIQNQGEAGVDCGGPCIDRCELEEPNEFNYAIILISIGLILLIIFIIYIVYRIIIIFSKKRDGSDRKNMNFKQLRGGSRKKRLQSLLNKESDNDKS